MAHITRSVPEVYTVNDREVRAYLAAGWRQATPEEYSVWARTSGRGQQRAPRAPALDPSSAAEHKSSGKLPRKPATKKG